MEKSTYDCENRLLTLISSQEWHLDRVYSEYTKELGLLLNNFSGSLPLYKKKELENVLSRFNIDLEKQLKKQIEKSFSLSDICNDGFIKNYIKDFDTKNLNVEDLFTKNENAVLAFINRKAAGLNLSDRVWAITQQTKDSLENVLESGIFNGRSSADMARDLKSYLKNPDQQFRRIRDAKGKLILSNPAKNYHPGQGVYRSSYKNALRLSRNEINIAYRTNDYERRQSMPFVTGQKVRLSAAHKGECFCEHLTGTYPKAFKFTGWHVSCICSSTSILLPREKFKEYLSSGEIDQRHLIKRIPNDAFKFLNEKAETIKGWKSTPYFITDNFKFSKNGFVLKAGI